MNSRAIIVFDGVCNFCDRTVQFVIRHDPKGYFQYTPLQSAAGQKILSVHGLSHETFDTFLLAENGRLYKRSSAALRVVRKLNGLWPLLYLFIAVPTPIRDLFYSMVARNRYKWFGKKESCMIPSPGVRSRFL